MKILMMAINDPAGTAIEFTKAINKYTEHSCRLITKEIRYNFMFEKDLHLPWLDARGWEEVDLLLRSSDVFHFHMTADEDIELGTFRPADYMKGKVIVHHHHGHPDFRDNPDKYRRKYQEKKRQNLLVSTPDLLKLLPEARWQPNLVPINDLPYLPMSVPANGKIGVCQSPTRKNLKNTDDFCAVVRRLQTRYDGLEMVRIENTPHMDCLRIKQSCDIHFDHMQGYFGVSSLESLSQGKPVIAGLDEWNQTQIRDLTGCSVLPWVIARNIEDLEKQLEKLVAGPDLRVHIGSRSREFMQAYWDDKSMAFRLVDFYLAI